MSFHLVTFSTHSERYYDLLQKRGPVTNIGWGKTWLGWYDRVQHMIRFCEKIEKQNKNALICFIDGFDTVILSDDPYREIPEKFEKHFHDHYDLVFASEMPHGMLSAYVRNKLFEKCDASFLNAGCYIGYPWAIKRFWASIQPGDDDQQYASSQCRSLINQNYNKNKTIQKHIEKFEEENRQSDNPIRFGLDKECVLFLNYFKGIPYTIEDNRLVLFGQNRPAILSGPAFQNLNPLLKKLGYDPQDLPATDYKILRKYYIDRTKAFAQYFFLEFIALFTLFVTVIFAIGSLIYALFYKVSQKNDKRMK